MRRVQTKEDWQKVRRLSRWRDTLPVWVYVAGTVICVVAVFVDNNRSALWILGLVFFVAKLGLKEGHEEGYVDGWDEAQNYATDDYTLDKLLEVNKPKEDKDNK